VDVRWCSDEAVAEKIRHVTPRRALRLDTFEGHTEREKLPEYENCEAHILTRFVPHTNQGGMEVHDA
jgi:hypothetical protein